MYIRLYTIICFFLLLLFETFLEYKFASDFKFDLLSNKYKFQYTNFVENKINSQIDLSHVQNINEQINDQNEKRRYENKMVNETEVNSNKVENIDKINYEEEVEKNIYYVDLFPGAPRTHIGKIRAEDLLQFRKKSKIFIFQPSGGFNNQRIILERAIQICSLLKRICIIPMAGRHSSFYSSYNKLSRNSLIEMDRVLDFNELRKFGAKILPLSTPLQSFIEQLKEKFPENENYWFKIEQTTAERKLNPLTLHNLTELENRPEKIIYFGNSTMWQRFDSDFEKEVYPFIKYSPFFRAMALDIIDSLNLKKYFVCFHSRASDHGEKWEKRMEKQELVKEEMKLKNSTNLNNKSSTHPPKNTKYGHKNGFSSQYLKSNDALDDPESYLKNQVEFIFSANKALSRNLKTLYVATKPNFDKKWYSNFTGLFDNIYLSSDIPIDIMSRFDKLFNLPNSARLRNDLLGIIEQIICARSYMYIGFKGSSFAEYIDRLRQESFNKLELIDL